MVRPWLSQAEGTREFRAASPALCIGGIKRTVINKKVNFNHTFIDFGECSLLMMEIKEFSITPASDGDAGGSFPEGLCQHR